MADEDALPPDDVLPPSHIALLMRTLVGGGAEEVAHQLSIAFAQHGHRVDLVVMSARGELATAARPGVRLVDLGRPRLWTSLPAIVRYLRSEAPDFLLTSMPLANGYAGLAKALARARGTTAVGSEHAYLTLMFGDFASLRNRLSAALLRPGYRRLDAIVAVSSGIAARLARARLVPTDRPFVIYNPVRPPEAEDGSAGVGRPRDLPNWETTILNVGRLDPQKDQVTLLRAFATLAGTRDAGLVILGEGEERQRLEGLAGELGIAERLHMPGWAEHVGPYFRAADLFVLSSSYEGFGLVLVEAMAHGLPVVSTDCPAGPGEILDEERYGRLAPVGDAEALAIAMAEELAAPHPAELLQARAADFSIERAASAYLELFASLRATTSARQAGDGSDRPDLAH